MALPVSVPYSFANATTTQNLSYLDSNFNTLSYTLNGIGNGTVSLSNVSITGGTISANLSASGIFSGTSNVVITSSSGPVSISTNGNNAFYIDASQNVGIGTTTPSQKLDVKGISQFTNSSNSTNNSYIYDGGGLLLQSNNNNPMYFYTGGSEKIRIDVTGNMLFGTSNASGKVTVVATGSNAGVYSTSANNYSVYGQASGAYAIYGSQSGSTYGAVFGIESTGKYGIIGYQGLGLITNASINVNGTTYTSDQRLKENIVTISNALNTIKALNPVSFNWKPNSSRGSGQAVPDFGLIAQEVEQVIPECVFETKTPPRTPEMSGPVYLEEELGSYKGVDYSRFIPFLIAALKESASKIDALETRIATLETK
jgi:hypothetical protein